MRSKNNKISKAPRGHKKVIEYYDEEDSSQQSSKNNTPMSINHFYRKDTNNDDEDISHRDQLNNESSLNLLSHADDAAIKVSRNGAQDLKLHSDMDQPSSSLNIIHERINERTMLTPAP